MQYYLNSTCVVETNESNNVVLQKPDSADDDVIIVVLVGRNMVYDGIHDNWVVVHSTFSRTSDQSCIMIANTARHIEDAIVIKRFFNGGPIFAVASSFRSVSIDNHKIFDISQYYSNKHYHVCIDNKSLIYRVQVAVANDTIKHLGNDVQITQILDNTDYVNRCLVLAYKVVDDLVRDNGSIWDEFPSGNYEMSFSVAFKIEGGR